MLAGNDLAEGEVAIPAEVVGLVEHDVEGHGGGCVGFEPGQHFSVHGAGPGPVAGVFVHFLEASLVDRNHDDVVRRLARLRVPGQQPVAQAIVGPVQGAGEVQDQRDDGQGQQGQADGHVLGRRHAPECSRLPPAGGFR